MRIFISIVFMTLFLSGFAQQTIYDEATVLYKKEFKAGIKFHGHGWGFFATKGYHKSVDKVWNLNFSMVSMKNPNEDRRINFWDERAKSYIYGKSNYFYVLRPSVGQRKIVAYKDRKSGVEFGYTWALGPSIGITKPFYLQIAVPVSVDQFILVEEQYNPNEHFIGNIYGRASWFNGLNELQTHFGAYGKFGFVVEYSGDQTGIQGIETGISIDAFPNDIPIMTTELGSIDVDKNKNLFFNFYANIFFGKKYN